MNQYQFSRMTADAFTIERLRDFVFVGVAPEIAQAAAERVVVLWNRFVHVPTEAFEGEVRESHVANLTAFCAWEKALRRFYPDRAVDVAAMNRLIGLLSEAEQVYGSMPAAVVSPPSTEAQS